MTILHSVAEDQSADPTDARLLRSWANNDRRAGLVFINRHKARIEHALRRGTGGRARPTDLEDLRQEVFIRTYSAAGLCSRLPDAGGWMWCVAFRLGIDFVRSRKREAKYFIQETRGFDWIPSVGESPDIEMERRECEQRYDAVRERLRGHKDLPPRVLLMIREKFFENTTFQALAERHGLGTDAEAKDRAAYEIRKGLKAIRENVTEEEFRMLLDFGWLGLFFLVLGGAFLLPRPAIARHLPRSRHSDDPRDAQSHQHSIGIHSTPMVGAAASFLVCTVSAMLLATTYDTSPPTEGTTGTAAAAVSRGTTGADTDEDAWGSLSGREFVLDIGRQQATPTQARYTLLVGERGVVTLNSGRGDTCPVSVPGLPDRCEGRYHGRNVVFRCAGSSAGETILKAGWLGDDGQTVIGNAWWVRGNATTPAYSWQLTARRRRATCSPTGTSHPWIHDAGTVGIVREVCAEYPRSYPCERDVAEGTFAVHGTGHRVTVSVHTMPSNAELESVDLRLPSGQRFWTLRHDGQNAWSTRLPAGLQLIPTIRSQTHRTLVDAPLVGTGVDRSFTRRTTGTGCQ